jgi:hypothetical protein
VRDVRRRWPRRRSCRSRRRPVLPLRIWNGYDGTMVGELARGLRFAVSTIGSVTWAPARARRCRNGRFQCRAVRRASDCRALGGGGDGEERAGPQHGKNPMTNCAPSPPRSSRRCGSADTCTMHSSDLLVFRIRQTCARGYHKKKAGASRRPGLFVVLSANVRLTVRNAGNADAVRSDVDVLVGAARQRRVDQARRGPRARRDTGSAVGRTDASRRRWSWS